jgi:hypothetical protein
MIAMTARETLISTLETLGIFYCEPSDDVLYISVSEGAENIYEIEALYDLIGIHSEIGWCETSMCDICTVYGLTIEWTWEAWE